MQYYFIDNTNFRIEYIIFKFDFLEIIVYPYFIFIILFYILYMLTILLLTIKKLFVFIEDNLLNYFILLNFFFKIYNL